MRIVIVGGGVVGLTLWRLLARHGVGATVVERRRPGGGVPRPFMLPYHGFPALRDAGVWERVHAISWEIAPEAPQGAVAVTADGRRVLTAR